MFKLNQSFPERCLPLEIHLRNGLLEQFCVNLLQTDDKLDANVLNVLVLLSQYNHGVSHYFNTFVIELYLIAKNDREMLQKQ